MLPMPEQFARTSPPKCNGGKRSQSAASEAKRYGEAVWQRWFEKLMKKHTLFPRLNEGLAIAGSETA
jgi:hypothetical protein